MRTRNVRPGFFTNDTLCGLPPLDRILFAGLWCLADCAGRLADRPRRIKAELLPYDDHDCAAALDRLNATGFIVRYRVGEGAFIAIPKFRDHQYLSADERKRTSDIPAPPAAPEPPRDRQGITTVAIPKSHGSASEAVPKHFDRTTDNCIPDNGHQSEGVQGDPSPAPAEPVPARTRSATVPIPEIVEAWNTIAAPAGATACNKVADAWKGAIRARWHEAGSTDEERMAAFRAQFETVAASPLCTGKVAHGDRKPWRASLDWLVKEGNWAKVANGNYDDPHARQRLAAERRRQDAPEPEPPPHPCQTATPEELAQTAADAERAWMQVKDVLRWRIDAQEMDHWIEPLKPLGILGTALILDPPSGFDGHWITHNYLDVLRDVFLDSGAGLQPFIRRREYYDDRRPE